MPDNRPTISKAYRQFVAKYGYQSLLTSIRCQALPENPAPEIYVDADACPVKAEVERVADRHGLAVHIVSNGGIRPSPNPRVQTVIVPEGADAADDWIAERMGPNDIAITADIPLAARCLAKGATVLRPDGKPFTEQGIGMALGIRELNRHLREVTGGQTYHAGFTKQDRSQFLNALEIAIQTIKRRAR
jgi:uncharacterized protein YaiI (UPF0178 family)